MKTLAYAAHDSKEELKPFSLERRSLREDDVAIDILYSGVCHSDLHQARNDWGGSQYPLVPGHEIIGKVTAIGNNVTKFKVGDNVGVGCMVDSCQQCDPCNDHEEQFCNEGMTGTYNSKDRVTGEMTYGGYSQRIVVKDKFVLNIPDNMDLAKVAPILCAGITTYSPLAQWNIKAGDSVAVVGIGGLGHMAVKIAAAMGAEVTVFTRSESKKEEANSLGAKHVILSTDKDQMKAAKKSFDFILNTIPVPHDISPYLNTLKIDGSLVIVGVIGELPSFHTGLLLGGRRRVSASLIGGIKQTQETIDFCAKHQVYPEVEMIKMDEINTAFERMKNGDVKYRFVIDMDSLK